MTSVLDLISLEADDIYSFHVRSTVSQHRGNPNGRVNRRVSRVWGSLAGCVEVDTHVTPQVTHGMGRLGG